MRSSPSAALTDRLRRVGQPPAIPTPPRAGSAGRTVPGSAMMRDRWDDYKGRPGMGMRERLLLLAVVVLAAACSSASTGVGELTMDCGVAGPALSEAWGRDFEFVQARNAQCSYESLEVQTIEEAGIPVDYPEVAGYIEVLAAPLRDAVALMGDTSGMVYEAEDWRFTRHDVADGTVVFSFVDPVTGWPTAIGARDWGAHHVRISAGTVDTSHTVDDVVATVAKIADLLPR